MWSSEVNLDRICIVAELVNRNPFLLDQDRGCSISVLSCSLYALRSAL
jgi:hypothetical protein